MIRRATEEAVGERYVDFRTMAAAVAETGEKPGQATLPLKRKSKLPQIVAVLLVMAVGAMILTNWSGLEVNTDARPSGIPTPAPAPAQETTSAPPPNPPPSSGRTPKFVNYSQEDFPSIREQVIKVIFRGRFSSLRPTNDHGSTRMTTPTAPPSWKPIRPATTPSVSTC